MLGAIVLWARKLHEERPQLFRALHVEGPAGGAKQMNHAETEGGSLPKSWLNYFKVLSGDIELMQIVAAPVASELGQVMSQWLG